MAKGGSSKPTASIPLSLALLFARVVAAGSMLGLHGWKKWEKFGELKETFSDPLNVGSATSLVLTIGAEVGCAALVVVGLFTRLASVPLVFTMAVAAFWVHAGDPWAKRESALIYLAVFSVFLATGPGRFSVDAALFKRDR